ncbi:MAG TPA: hypothetical protein VH559_11310 [Gemmatimonadaceae bacterium]|jgi:hypothetical protein
MDSPATNISLTTAIDPPWTAIAPIRLGGVPAGLGTADLFALITLPDGERIRLDLYRAGDSEFYFPDEVIAWHEWIVVGFGHRVFLIHALDRHVNEVPLPLYFEGFRSSAEYLLVLAGEGLVRLDRRGHLVWTSARLAIDGVEVDLIENGVISGRGEWDPPGGWRPFHVRLDTGQLIDAVV